MVELVDTNDLKSFDHCDRAGSNPVSSILVQKITVHKYRCNYYHEKVQWQKYATLQIVSSHLDYNIGLIPIIGSVAQLVRALVSPKVMSSSLIMVSRADWMLCVILAYPRLIESDLQLQMYFMEDQQFPSIRNKLWWGEVC